MASSSVTNRSKDLRLAKVNAGMSSLHTHVAGTIRHMLIVLHLPPVLVALRHRVADVCTDFQR